MNANVLRGISKFGTEDLVKARAEVGEAIVRVTLTTICGTDLHTVRGEYPVKPGLVIGHEPVGLIEELGDGTLLAIGCWLGPSRPAVNVGRGSRGTRRNAAMATVARRSAVGALETR